MSREAGKIGPFPWMTAPETRAVMEALTKEGGRARFVGGCVRNALLGRPVDDVDIATTHSPEEVIRLLKEAGLKAVPTGVEHGTVTAVSNGTPFEVTTLRKDVATDGRRAVVAFTDDWAEDAQRRDFTMNALYLEADGTLHDYVGGIEDAKAGRVRFIGDARARIREDYLRILRLFRFHAWYGADEPDARALEAASGLRGGLKKLSGERVQKELLKLLAADDPLPALRRMAATKVLGEVLPEARRMDRLAKLVEIETGQLFTCDPVLRLGALLEDAAGAAQVAGRLRLSNADRDRLVHMHEQGPRIVCYLSAREVRRILYRLGARTFEDRAMLAWADDPKETNAVQWRALLAMAQSWRRPKLPLTGEEVIAAGVPEGEEVGRVMREVEEWWIDSDFTGDRFSIIERLKAVVQATVR
ncbi:MAG: CCA tRNA nucleotidyltransferase [Alphaproteobacteria bacterium]